MPSLHNEHLENFITEVVDDFDGDFACRGSHERPASGAVKEFLSGRSLKTV